MKESALVYALEVLSEDVNLKKEINLKLTEENEKIFWLQSVVKKQIENIKKLDVKAHLFSELLTIIKNFKSEINIDFPSQRFMQKKALYLNRYNELADSIINQAAIFELEKCIKQIESDKIFIIQMFQKTTLACETDLKSAVNKIQYGDIYRAYLQTICSDMLMLKSQYSHYSPQCSQNIKELLEFMVQEVKQFVKKISPRIPKNDIFEKFEQELMLPLPSLNNAFSDHSSSSKIYEKVGSNKNIEQLENEAVTANPSQYSSVLIKAFSQKTSVDVEASDKKLTI